MRLTRCHYPEVINRHDTYWGHSAPPTPGASARRALAPLGIKTRAARALLPVPGSATASVPRRLFGDRGPVAERQHRVRPRRATPSGGRASPYHHCTAVHVCGTPSLAPSAAAQ